MPDILIRGMEMPVNCGGCYLNHGEFCFMLCRKLILPQEWEARPSNCPLVELPPHGDLIDGDAVLNKIDAYVCGSQDSEFIKNEIIKAMPVIVPASEGVE